MSVENTKHSDAIDTQNRWNCGLSEGTCPWKLRNHSLWSWKHVGNFICISSEHFEKGGIRNRTVVSTVEEPIISKPKKPRHFHRNVKCMLSPYLSPSPSPPLHRSLSLPPFSLPLPPTLPPPSLSLSRTCMLPISSCFRLVEPFMKFGMTITPLEDISQLYCLLFYIQ